MIYIAVIALAAGIAGVSLEKARVANDGNEFIQIQMKGSAGAAITACALNAALNDYFNEADGPGKPTLKESVRRVFEKDKQRFANRGLIGYINADAKKKEAWKRDLAGWQFSDEEIEQVLAQ